MQLHLWNFQVLSQNSLVFTSSHQGDPQQLNIPAEETNFGLALYHLRSSCCYNAAAMAIETAGGPSQTDLRHFARFGGWDNWEIFSHKHRQASG